MIWLRRKALNDLFETVFDIRLPDAINKNLEEGLSSKDEVLFILFELAVGCISAMAANAVFAELICCVEVTGAHINNAKVLYETFVVKVMGSRSNNTKGLQCICFLEAHLSITHTICNRCNIQC